MASAREVLEMKERRAWMEQERENENRKEYERYLAQEKNANSKVPPAHRVEPASYSEFRKAMPDDEPASLIRGSVASSVLSLRRLGKVAIDRIMNAELSDEELRILGFDPEDRVVIPEALSIPGIADAFKHFAKSEKRYVADLHYFPISDFTVRNKLFPSDRHIALTFNHLYDLHLLPEPVEPERPSGLNEHGVNLTIRRDPELEAKLAVQKRRAEYGTKIVATGPDGRQYTQYQIDNVLTADESLRVMRFMEGR